MYFAEINQTMMVTNVKLVISALSKTCIQFAAYGMYLCDRTEYNFCYLNFGIPCVFERSETPSTPSASRKYAWLVRICLSSYFKTRNICSFNSGEDSVPS